MPDNVKNFEPGKALFVADNDPLIFYRAINRFSHSALKTGGMLFLEINEAFGSETVDLLSSEFCNIELRKDLNGKFRMIKAIKK